MINDIDKDWFQNYMEELGELYHFPKLTAKKIDIYFNFLSAKGFYKLQYEEAKNQIMRNKRDQNFPTVAEIIDNIKVDRYGNGW